MAFCWRPNSTFLVASPLQTLGPDGAFADLSPGFCPDFLKHVRTHTHQLKRLRGQQHTIKVDNFTRLKIEITCG